MITISKKEKEPSLKENPLHYFDITSKDYIKFNYILIKNYYVSSIQIKIYIHDEYQTVLDNYTLMPNPNIEEGAEKYFLIPFKEFKLDNSSIEEVIFNTMRIYLIQPSNVWKEYTLSLIKLITEEDLKDENNSKNISYIVNPKSKFVFKEKNATIIDDAEEINQNYIENSNKSSSEIKINYFI